MTSPATEEPASPFTGLAIAALAGGITALAPVPVGWNSAGFLGPILLFAAIDGRDRAPTAVRGWLCGWAFSTVVNAAALYWLVGLLQRFASFPLGIAVPTASLLWLAQGLATGVAGAGATIITRSATAKGIRWLPLSVTLPPLAVLTTSLAPSLFPWRVGHSQMSWLPYLQVAEIGGESLVDLLTWCVSGCLYGWLRSGGHARPFWGACFLLIGPWLYGVVRISEVETERQKGDLLRVGVVQPNVSIEDKRDPRLRRGHLIQLQRLSLDLQQRGADVVVWPESAYPYGFSRNQSRDFLDFRSVRGTHLSVPLLVGAITYGPSQSRRNRQTTTPQERPHRYNSVVAVDRWGRFVGMSDKVVLLAFGEYTPWWEHFPILQKHFPRGLTPGRSPEVLELEQTRYGVLNCYEDVLSEPTRRVALAKPDLLVNVTNDAWFGTSTEPHLHQMVARMRAIETRRDLVRSVNTGVSSHISATGQTLFKTETWKEATFIAPVRILRRPTLFSLAGNWPTAAIFCATLGLALVLRFKRFEAS